VVCGYLQLECVEFIPAVKTYTKHSKKKKQKKQKTCSVEVCYENKEFERGFCMWFCNTVSENALVQWQLNGSRQEQEAERPFSLEIFNLFHSFSDRHATVPHDKAYALWACRQRRGENIPRRL
jgi:hypothetical protein